MSARIAASILAVAACGVAVVTGTLGAAPHPADSADWPRWRGAQFDGTAATGTGLLAKPFRLEVRWRRTLGPGYSGVVVADGHAVTTFSDGRNDVLVSLASDTGREEWRLPLGPTFPGRDGSAGGPVSTPAIDGDLVFALGPRGDLVAAQLADGREVWRRQLVRDFDAIEPHWGFTTSPLVAGDGLIVFTGGAGGRALTALHRRTGGVLWRAGDDEVSYQSPMLLRLGDTELLVAGGERFLTAFDPRDGRELWKRVHGGAGFYAKIINPVRVGRDRLLLTFKPDQSVLLAGAGSPAGPSPAWTTRELKLNYATPVAAGDLIFGYSGAFLTAVDARTGQLAWRSRPPGDGFPILVDNHLVVLTKQGRLAIAPAHASGFQPKASLALFTGLVWTPPSFAEGRIFARDSYEEIAAVDIVPASRMTDATASEAAVPGRLPATGFGRWVAATEGASDPGARIEEWLDTHSRFPVIEGDRIVHLIYRGEGKDVRVRGDLFGTGADLPMHRVGSSDLFYASVQVEPDARFSYQFVRDLGDPFPDPRNPDRGTSQNYAGPVSLALMPQAPRDLPPAAASGLRGRVVDLAFDSGSATAEHLRWGGPREVHVYLPPGYDDEPARRYPSVYVLYGNEMLQDGRLAAALEGEGRAVARSVLVFVQSTSAYEYARSFRAAHTSMLAERLVPWIDGQFRTARTPAHRVLLGADEGGFAALEIGLRHPGVFGRIAAQSIFPLSGGEEELMALIDRGPNAGQRLWVDWGKYDPRRTADRLDVPGVSARLRDRLAARGHDVNGRGWNDGSVVQFWAARAVVGLRTLLPSSSGGQ